MTLFDIVVAVCIVVCLFVFTFCLFLVTIRSIVLLLLIYHDDIFFSKTPVKNMRATLFHVSGRSHHLRRPVHRCLYRVIVFYRSMFLPVFPFTSSLLTRVLFLSKPSFCVNINTYVFHF